MTFIDDTLFHDEELGAGEGSQHFDVTQLLMNFQMNEPIFDNHLLNPTPVESEIMHFKGDRLSTGTLEGIICLLTSPEVINYTNMIDFFLTFRSFIDPLPLLELILCRLSWSLKSNNPMVIIRVFVCLRHWILNHFQDFINDSTLRGLYTNTINEMCKYNQFMDSIIKMNCLRDLKRSFIKSCEIYFKKDSILHQSDDDILYIDLDHLDNLPRLSKIALKNLTDPSTRRSGILSMIDQPKLQSIVHNNKPMRPNSFKQFESLNGLTNPKSTIKQNITNDNCNTSLDLILDQLVDDIKKKEPLNGVITFDNLKKDDFGFSLNGKVEIFKDSHVNTIKKEKADKVRQKEVIPKPQVKPKIVKEQLSKPGKPKRKLLKLLFGKRQPLNEITLEQQSQSVKKTRVQTKQKPSIRSSNILHDLETSIDPNGKLDFISELTLQDYKLVIKSHHPKKKRISIPLSFKDNSEVIDWSNSNINGDENENEFIDMNVQNSTIKSNGWSINSNEDSYMTYDSNLSNDSNRKRDVNFNGKLRRKDGFSNLRLPTDDDEEEEIYSVHGELENDLHKNFETSSQLYDNSNNEFIIDSTLPENEIQPIEASIDENLNFNDSQHLNEEDKSFDETELEDLDINEVATPTKNDIQQENENGDNDDVEFTTPVVNTYTPKVNDVNSETGHYGFDFKDTTPVKNIQLGIEPTDSASDSQVFKFDHSLENYQDENEEDNEINLTQFTQHESPLNLRQKVDSQQSQDKTEGSSFLAGFGNGPPISFSSNFSKDEIDNYVHDSPITSATEDIDRFTFEFGTNMRNFSELPFNNKSKDNSLEVSMIPSPIQSMGEINYNGISQTDIIELAKIPDELHDDNPINWALNKLRGQTPKQQQDGFEPQIIYGLNDELTTTQETPKSPHENHKKHAVGIICQSPTKELDLERQIRDLYITNVPLANRMSTSSLPLEMNIISRSGSILTRTSTSKLLLTDGDDNKSNFDLQSLTLIPKDNFNIDNVMENGQHIPFILEFDLNKILNQFTLIEKDILMDIDWKELINLKFDNILTPFNSWLRVLIDNDAKTGVELVTLRFNLMTNWVKSEVLLCKDLSLRILTITKFIELAWLGLQSQNFVIVFQIMFALNSDILKNLQSTWIRINPGSILKLKKMRDFISPLDNYKCYRTKLGDVQLSKGIIPFLPLDLSDLTINAELPTIIKGEVEDDEEDCYDLINFEKLQEGCKIVKNIIRMIEWSRFFKRDMDHIILSKCLYIGCLSEDEMIKCLNLLNA